MGNTPLETKVTYQVVNKAGDITISYQDLKGSNKYPKPPKKEASIQGNFR